MEEKAPQFQKIVGCSMEIQAVERLIDKIAESSATILVTGENGTGKELIARAIHAKSLRKEQRFVPVDCGALCCQILESELFGHVRGAFTGALADKPGLVELACGGTLFLDEIGNLELSPQQKLLRFLEGGEYRALGGVQLRRADVRVIAATNRDVCKDVLEGRFREDLYYRLNQFEIRLPPLRDRRTDIPLLVEHFLGYYRKKTGRDCGDIEPGALEALLDYKWPGNIRELAHAIQHMVLMSEGSGLGYQHLPQNIRIARNPEELDSTKIGYRETRKHALDVFNKRYLESAMLASRGYVTLAAEKSGLSRQTFQDLLKRYHIRSKDYRIPGFPTSSSRPDHSTDIPMPDLAAKNKQRDRAKGMPDPIPFHIDRNAPLSISAV